VARDADRAALAGQRRLREVAGALAQGAEVGPFDDDVVAPDRRHAQPADRVALPVAAALEAGELGQRLVGIAKARDRRERALVGLRLVVQSIQLAVERGLVAAGHERRDGLLPGEREARIQQQEKTAAHQHRCDEMQNGA
jgi:hypothetical protein